MGFENRPLKSLLLIWQESDLERIITLTKEKIILDTDIGTDVDDALALAYLLSHPRCELVGITTVTGQADVRARLASVVCHVAGMDDIPIFPGAEDCILIEQREKYVPQATVLSKWNHGSNFPKHEAIPFMRQMIRENPGEITLLGIAPMGNIARLFLLDPEIPSLLKGLYLMCGKFSQWEFRPWINYAQANEHKPTAFEPAYAEGIVAGGLLEMNAVIDPFATGIVYQQKVTVHRSVGIDMTQRVKLTTRELRERSGNHEILRPVLDMAEVNFAERDDVVFHDPLATVCIFNADICGFTRGNVEVELESNRLRGHTSFEEDPEGQHEVASSVSPQRFFEEYFSVFS
ncbi:MAG: nucleoside hydrolase [Chloroflexota bacterium]